MVDFGYIIMPLGVFFLEVWFSNTVAIVGSLANHYLKHVLCLAQPTSDASTILPTATATHPLCDNYSGLIGEHANNDNQNTRTR